MDLVQIRVFENHEPVYSADFAEPFEIGRQVVKEEPPFTPLRQPSGAWRLVIARVEEDTISRQHLRIEPLEGGRVRLRNLREKLSIRLEDSRSLAPRTTCEVTLPCLLVVGRKAVRLEAGTEEGLQGLMEATQFPGQVREHTSQLETMALPPGFHLDALFPWLRTAMGVLQSAAGSKDFAEEAVQKAKEMLRLDTCRLLMLEKEEWRSLVGQPVDPPSGDAGWRASQHILARVREEKRTFFKSPKTLDADASSLAGIRAVVAAPVRDRQGEVRGALYGDRRLSDKPETLSPISRLEALLFEMLAVGVANGFARVEQEKEAVKGRVLLEQFFTPDLAHFLAANPERMDARDAEVTVLFCDIRGFSRISDRLGPARTVEWSTDVLQELSECVLDHKGTLVDYNGDEVMAMWGAPADQPDHARIACAAALDMLDRIPRLSDRWHDVLHEPVGVGIGINTGPAQVGNVGSRHKRKYGPRGTTVNLASRVQGATKFLKVDLLITGSTCTQLGAGFQTRRLARVRVVNIPEPVDLYQLSAGDKPNWPILKEHYERALSLFENCDFRAAAHELGMLVRGQAGDGPSLVLLSRAVNQLVEENATFDPVWVLPGK